MSADSELDRINRALKDAQLRLIQELRKEPMNTGAIGALRELIAELRGQRAVTDDSIEYESYHLLEG